MKVCPDCEYENTDDSIYCAACGASLTSKTFLNNAYEGKNNWWRYLITVIATWGSQIALGTIIGIVLILILMMQGNFSLTSYDEYLHDPFFLLPLTLVGFGISYIVLYLCMRFIHLRSFLSFITTKSKINWMRILKGAVIWLAILGIFTFISFLIDPQGYQFTFNPNTFGILFIISLITFPIQASFEELFFRGYLMQGFGLVSKKPIISLLATSIIFGFAHIANGNNIIMIIVAVIQAFILGLMLGIITLGEDSIETATGIHIMNNLYVALIVSTQDSVLGNVPSVFTAPADTSSSIIWTILFALIALAIIFWGKKDKLMAIFK